jgi:GNAT superfamily N-acetyltransferase
MTTQSDVTTRAFALRTHKPGDLGWIVHRHGKLYADEHGYDERFEGIVAGIAGEFLRRHDPLRERCWIAEMEGKIAGCVMLVKATDDTARLRLMLVEPDARNHGIAAALMRELLQFARGAGYRKVVLWTHANLEAARRLYERTGFRLARTEGVEDFGRVVMAETWEQAL